MTVDSSGAATKVPRRHLVSRAKALIGRSGIALVIAAPGGVVGRDATSSFRDTPPPVIDSLGFWSLERLHSPAIEFADVTHVAKQAIPYVLPDGAHQGPARWYAIRLHAQIALGSGTGSAYLFAAHNGLVSALIEFDARSTSKGRQILQRTESYIDGSRVKLLRGSGTDFRFRNFLQYRAVQAGLNELTFSIEVHGSLTVAHAKILADSGIDYTRQGPAHLMLRVIMPRSVLKLRHGSPLTVQVRNTGDRLIRNVAVSIDVSPHVLRVGGGQRVKIGDLKPSVVRRRTVTVTPLRRGSIRILFGAAGSGGNQPAVERTLIVR